MQTKILDPMKNVLFMVFVAILISCNSSKSNENSSVENSFENKLTSQFMSDFLWRLTDASSYEGGAFRYMTIKPNGETVYFLDSTIYMITTGKHELFGDTIFDGRFFVYHIFRATNKLGGIVTEIAEACYDSHFTLLANEIDFVSVEQEMKRVNLIQKEGHNVKPLTMIK
jgi:hypothetical protein